MPGSYPQLAGQFPTHSIMLINIKLNIYNKKKVATNNFTKFNFKSYKNLRKKQCKIYEVVYMNETCFYIMISISTVSEYSIALKLLRILFPCTHTF